MNDAEYVSFLENVEAGLAIADRLPSVKYQEVAFSERGYVRLAEPTHVCWLGPGDDPSGLAVYETDLSVQAFEPPLIEAAAYVVCRPDEDVEANVVEAFELAVLNMCDRVRRDDSVIHLIRNGGLLTKQWMESDFQHIQVRNRFGICSVAAVNKQVPLVGVEPTTSRS